MTLSGNVEGPEWHGKLIPLAILVNRHLYLLEWVLTGYFLGGLIMLILKNEKQKMAWSFSGEEALV